MSWRQSSVKKLFVLLSLTFHEVTSLSMTPHTPGVRHTENGQNNPTTYDDPMTKKIPTLSLHISNLLGFAKEPTNETGQVPHHNRSAPTFLRSIYGLRQNRNEGDESVRQFNISQHELIAIDRSDEIITFPAQQWHHAVGKKCDNIKRMWFDTTKISLHVKITSASLRIYRGLFATNQTHRGDFVITVYRVSKLKNSKRELHHVDSFDFSAGYQGWINLNVTEALRHWMTDVTENRGIYLKIIPINSPQRGLCPEDIGIVGLEGDVKLQPFIVGFFENNGPVHHHISNSILNRLDLETTRRKRRNDLDNLLRQENFTVTEPKRHKETRMCKIQSLRVSFEDLHWRNWIMAPEGYDADFCDGECKFPPGNDIDVTNHAVIQSLVHLSKPDKVPKPCCTPRELSSILILYFLDDKHVIMKKFENMVVKSCGCH